MIVRTLLIPDGFDDLVKNFIAKAKEEERTVASIKKQIQSIIEDESGALWTIWDRSRLRGYFFAQMCAAEYGGTVCLVHQVYVRGIGMTILKQIDKVLENWTILRGSNELAFFTRRNSDAFIRSLSNGWKIDSVVLKRRIG